MNPPLELHITAITHRGCVREHNEDAIAVANWVCAGSSLDAPRCSVETLTSAPMLCLVADGMGGHRAGEVASRCVAERLLAGGADLIDEKSMATLLCSVNDGLYDIMARDPALRGMGSTAAGIVVTTDVVIFFNVGDSRVYREHDGCLRQLSTDDRPGVRPARASLAPEPRSAAITQALGGAPSHVAIAPHVGWEKAKPGACYLLCTDGLSDFVDVDAMETCLSLGDPEAVAALRDRAFEMGGEDNVSVVIVRIFATQ